MKQQYHINFEGLRNVWRTPTISRGAKVILYDLLQYAGVDGKSFPKEETLAANHNLSSRQVGNLISELKRVGLIDWQRGGFGNSNRYTFSEEIYCLIDNRNRKSTSVHSRSSVPLQTGNTIPTNVVSESSQLNTHTEPSSLKFIPCGQNECANGFIFNDSNNSYSKCECKIKYEHRKEGVA